MNIAQYCSFFHDGSLINIQQTENALLISMDSADIEVGELIDNIELSDRNSIKGVLHLENIQTVYINEEQFFDQLKMLGDTAAILDLKITDNLARMFLRWRNFPPKSKIEEYTDLKIECDKIYWQNIPDLFDPFR